MIVKLLANGENELRSEHVTTQQELINILIDFAKELELGDQILITDAHF